MVSFTFVIQDPAVTQATSSGTNGANGATEDYNPFAEEAKKEPEVRWNLGNLVNSIH